jgi:hypothetical protein
MNKIKMLIVTILITCLSAGLAACSEQTALDQLQEKNEAWLESADEVTLGDHFSIQEDMRWGMALEEVTAAVGEPLENNYETYISKVAPAALPEDGSWKGDGKTVKKAAFAKADIMSYYAFSEEKTLYEYGYQCYTPRLEQYDFLKAYYTKKYGKPKKEEFIWSDQTYKPTGKEDLYAMFNKGEVKVLTAWDIDELGTVLTVDWLNDPIKTQNNYGQISFFEKTGELELDEE